MKLREADRTFQRFVTEPQSVEVESLNGMEDAYMKAKGRLHDGADILTLVQYVGIGVLIMGDFFPRAISTTTQLEALGVTITGIFGSGILHGMAEKYAKKTQQVQNFRRVDYARLRNQV